MKRLKGQKKERKKKIEDLNKKFKTAFLANEKDPKPIDFFGQNYTYNDFNSLYDLLHGCRPDGWIYSENFAVLIEAKVGFARQNEFQIFRHLSGHMGFGLTQDAINNTIDSMYHYCTWEEIGDALLSVAPTNVFAQEFYNFLILTGEVMSLKFIADTGFDKVAMREQFPLFLKTLNEQVSIIDRNLLLANRPKDNLWDYFGYEKDGKASSDPHYSIGFWDNATDIALTTKNKSQIKKLLSSEAMVDFLYQAAMAEDKVLMQRIYLSLMNYRLIDHKRGQIRGTTQDTFNFMFLLSEIVSNKNPEDSKKAIKQVLKSMSESIGFAKQLGLGIRVLYPINQRNDTGGLLEANKALFEDEMNLIKLYANFIKNSLPLYKLLVK